MKLFKRLAAVAVAGAMILQTAAYQGITAFGAELYNCTGWYETAHAEWEDSNPFSAKIYYKSTDSSDYIQLNSSSDAVNTSLSVYDGTGYYDAAGYKNCVIRQTNSYFGIVDIMGIGYGDFDLQIVASDGTVYEDTVTILQEDRSGYAHFGADSDYIGAYTDEGVLKDNATVIYVTEANKNTVKWSSYTGIGDIAAHLYKDTQNGTGNSYAVRFIGEVDTTAWVAETGTDYTYEISESTGRSDGTYTDWKGKSNSYADTTNTGVAISNLNTKMTFYSGNTWDITYLSGSTAGEVSTSSTSSSKSEDTSLNMMDFKGGSNDSPYYLPRLTIEGVGTDGAVAKNWGIMITRGSGTEVRNINFKSYSEDACSADSSEYVWIHRCTFDVGANHCDLTGEQDKHEGDGSSDFTEDTNVTCSYNVYNGCHKTSLNGGSDSTKQYNYTYHHNFYNSCQSRLPLTRYVNVHSYNNYTYGASTAISARASAFVFSEANYYSNVNTVFGSASSSTYGSGFIKSYNDTFVSTTPSWSKYIAQASSRTDTITISTSVDSGNQHLSESTADGGYINNFDTNSTYFYYSNGASNVSYLTSAEEAADYVEMYSGVMNSDVLYEDIMSDGYTIIESDIELTPSNYTDSDITPYFKGLSSIDTENTRTTYLRFTSSTAVSFKTAAGATVKITAKNASTATGDSANTRTLTLSGNNIDSVTQSYTSGTEVTYDTYTFVSNSSAEDIYTVTVSANMNISSIAITFGDSSEEPSETTTEAGVIYDTAQLILTEAETISEATTLCDYFSITPTMEVDSSKKTVDGTTYTYRIKSGGATTVDSSTGPANRSISFKTADSAVIQFCAAMSGSDTSARNIVIYKDGDFTNPAATIPFTSTDPVMSKIYNLNGGGTYYITFSKGINIYSVNVAVGRSITTDNDGSGYIFTDSSDSYAVVGVTADDAEAHSKLTVTAVGADGEATAETDTVYEYATVDGFVIKPSYLRTDYSYLYVVQIEGSGGATDFTYSGRLT